MLNIFFSIVLAKPLIDFFWPLKLTWMDYSINLQGLTAAAAIPCALYFSIRRMLQLFPSFPSSISKPMRVVLIFCYCTFLIFSIFVSYKLLMKAVSLDRLIKYWATLSILPFFLELKFFRPALFMNFKTTRYLIWAVVTILMTSLVLQMIGLLPWQYWDISRFGPYGRVTGLYKHPLDLFRVWIWVYCFILILLVTDNHRTIRNWILLFFCQLVLLRSGYRVGLIMMLVIPVLLLFLRRLNIRATVFAISTLICGWSAWSVLPQSIIPGNLGITRHMIEEDIRIVKSKVWDSAVYLPTEVMRVDDKKVTAFQIFDIWNFFDEPAVNISREGLELSKANSDIAEKSSAPLKFGRGRSAIWLDHWNWILSWSLSEWLLGSPFEITSVYPNSIAEPHNQFLECLEYFGIIGSLIFFAALVAGIFALSNDVFSFWICLFVISVFSMTSEPLSGPTFFWWASLFLFLLPKLRSVDSLEQVPLHQNLAHVQTT